jgi:outer membrane protein assembly factor BamB
LSLALLLMSVNAACVNFRPPPAPIATSVAGNAPTPVWTVRAGRRLTGQVEVQDNTLYGGGVDRKVYAVDLTRGEVRWSSRLPGLIAGGVLLSGDTLFAASSRPEGRVYALQRETGKQIWKASSGPISTPLAMVNGTLIAQTQEGMVLGLDPATGKIRWHRRVGVARVAAAPAGGEELLVATTDSLIRLTTATGKVAQRAASPGTILSAWLLHQGNLIAGTTDSQVVSIHPDNLQNNWSVRVDAPVLATPAALGDTLFLASRMGTVYRINPGGEPKAQQIARLEWPVTAPLVIVNGQLLLGGADGTIRALRTNGQEIWRVRIWQPVELGPVELGDGLVAIGGNGDLHRYRR